MEVVHLHFDTIHSTNAWAKEHASELDKGKITLITAGSQTSGYGRFRRRWISPSDVNIYATFFFRVDAEKPDPINISQVLAYSAITLLEEKGLDVKIKWPNDLFVGGKKIAGVICEASRSPNYTDIILGIGINVNMSQENLALVNKPATSMEIESGKSWDTKALTEELKNRFVNDIDIFFNRTFSYYYPLLTERLAFVGEPIRLDNGAHTWKGILDGLNPDGSIRIRLEDDTMKSLYCGEIPY